MCMSQEEIQTNEGGLDYPIIYVVLFSMCMCMLQEEIQTLKEVQEAARQERKLMLLQQKEISKMRRDTQYYRKKIHRYRQHSRASVSPDRSRPRDPFSPVPSLDRTGRGRGTDDNSFSVGPSDVERDSSVAPSEHLEDSFPTYTPVRSGEVTLRSPDLSSNRSTPASRVVTRSPNTLSPMTATAATDSLTVKNLKKLSTTDPERYVLIYLDRTIYDIHAGLTLASYI